MVQSSLNQNITKNKNSLVLYKDFFFLNANKKHKHENLEEQKKYFLKVPRSKDVLYS